METKNRNGFVSAWLFIMIFSNVYTGIKYLLFSDNVIADLNMDVSKGLIMIEGLLALIIAFFALMVFLRKKWGFWGIIGLTIIVVLINIIMRMGTILSLAVGIGSIGILYLILQIKKDNVSAWEILE